MEHTVDIIDLIPVGQENAVSRKLLTEQCISYGLIDGKAQNPDRCMRKLLNKARENHVVINLSDGGGYFQPDKEDLTSLIWYIQQESRRLLAINKPLRYANKLLADMKAGRL